MLSALTISPLIFLASLIAKLDFPDAKESNVLLRSNSRSKSERRKFVSENYEVIMLIGDNLADFNDDFEEKISEERTKLTDNLSPSGKVLFTSSIFFLIFF